MYSLNWHYYLNIFDIFCWQDGIEIIFFNALFYGIICWRSKQKSYFLFLLLCIFACHYTPYASFNHRKFSSYFLSWISYFFSFHEKTLQRNLIALTHAPLPKKVAPNGQPL